MQHMRIRHPARLQFSPQSRFVSSAKDRRYGAFTLIELLVVIAIISVLAAMLLPALQQARSMAQATTCANNMKQFALTVPMFADDFDGYLPMATYVDKAAGFQGQLFAPESELTGLNWGWPTKRPSNCYWPYIEQLRQSICPSHPQAGTLLQSNRDLSWQQWNTYAVNVNEWSVRNKFGSFGSAWRKKLDAAKEPTKLFLFMDLTTSTTYMQFTNSGTSYNTLSTYHRGNSGTNASYFDGHVEWISHRGPFIGFNVKPLENANFGL